MASHSFVGRTRCSFMAPKKCLTCIRPSEFARQAETMFNKDLSLIRCAALISVMSGTVRGNGLKVMLSRH